MQTVTKFFRLHRQTILMVLVLFLAVFLAFGTGLKGEFVWDDEEQVVANTAIHDLRNIPALFAGSTFNSGGSQTLGGMYYKPLMSVVFSLIYAIVGQKPFLFHLVQVSIHCLNTFILFILLRRLYVVHIQKTHAHNSSILSWVAFGGTLLFAIHPLNVETALYISALQDTIYFFFGISAFLILVQYVDTRQALLPYIKRVPHVATIMFLLLCSLLSKETGILFVMLGGLYILLFYRGRLYGKVTVLSFLGLPVVLYALLRFGYAHVWLLKNDISPISAAPFAQRMLTLPKVIHFYISNAVYPRDLLIAQHWVVKTATFNDFYIPLGVALLLLTVVCVLCLKMRSRLALFFSGWVVLGLGLHIHIFPLDMTVADRWAYFPLAGMVGLLCCVLLYINSRITFLYKRHIIVTLFSVFLVTFFMRSIVRAQNWTSSLALYGNDIEQNPGAYDLQNNYGVILFRANLYDEALSHFERSIQLEPRWWTNWNNAGAIYERKGNLQKAQTYYEKAIAHSTYYLAYENYANILLKQGKLNEAQSFIKIALQTFPQNARLLQMQKILESSQGVK